MGGENFIPPSVTGGIGWNGMSKVTDPILKNVSLLTEERKFFLLKRMVKISNITRKERLKKSLAMPELKVVLCERLKILKAKYLKRFKFRPKGTPISLCLVYSVFL